LTVHYPLWRLVPVSEYQYYEFVTVDRPLTVSQQEELRALSTRAQITASSFVNEYHWGDLRGDPRVWMERYFDAFLYLASWCTHRVGLRLPIGLLDPDVAAAYCVGESACSWATREHVILDLNSEEEDCGWQEDGEGRLASIMPARAELVAGDTRVLYLAWLLCVQAEELDEDHVEPPIPPGLGDLSTAQRRFADFLRLDQDLLAAAAEASGVLTSTEPSAAELTQWVKGLPEEDKNAVVIRLLCGDDAHLRTELLRRFRGPSTHAAVSGRRTAGELLANAEEHRVKRQQLAEERAAAEHARREQAAAAAREQRLQALEPRQEQAWQQIADLIESRKPNEYDAAVELLDDLKALSERDGNTMAFNKRVRGLREKHARKPSLLNRLDRARL
jgi:hypothetical protein